MMPHGENWGAPSVIAALAALHRESTASYERDDDNDSYYGSVHSPVPSRIERPQSSGLGSFFTQTNRALGCRGMGKRPTCRYLRPATILNLYRIAPPNRRWISGITRLAPNCERAADRGEHRQAAGAAVTSCRPRCTGAPQPVETMRAGITAMIRKSEMSNLRDPAIVE